MIRFGALLHPGLLLSALAGAGAAGLDADEPVAPLVARIKAVRPEGAGNAEAGAASRRLAALGPEALLEVLRSADGAGALAANWLRAAVDSIAERALQSGRPLPAAELEAFALDRSRAGPVRRLAYDWLCRVDTGAPDRLIPGMLDDPSVEMRRDAVARDLEAAERLLGADDKEAALAAFKRLFPASRDPDQVERIAKRLESLGHPVDLTRHFGCLQGWRLIGPFDNADKTGFDAIHPPELGVDFAAEHAGKGSRVRWIPHSSPDPYGLVDLNKVLGKHMGAVAYGAVELSSAVERPVSIRAGTPNALKLWLNGKLLVGRDEYHHGTNMDQYQAEAALQPGMNLLLIKVCQNEQTEDWAQSWTFQVRVCDLTGGGLQ